jgi:signal peptidase I
MSDIALSQRASWTRALWAGLLSLVQSGLGQIDAGAWRLGLVLYLAGVALTLSWIAVTWVVLPTPGAVVASAIALLFILRVIAIDAFRRVYSRSIAIPRPWYRSTWVAAIIMIAINISLQLSETDLYSPGWRNFHIASASNMPTLSTTDYVLADTHHPAALPAYGDVVVFRHPRDPKVDYIKRVVGLPGDRVQLREGILYLNGKPIPREPQDSAPRSSALKQYRETLPNGRAYMILETSQSASENTVEFNVPPGSFFVLGDNRGNSLDSRFKDLGDIPVENVIGIIRTIYWTTELTRLLSRVQ